MDQLEQAQSQEEQIGQPPELMQTGSRGIRIDKAKGLSSYNLFCRELCSVENEMKEMTNSERFALFAVRWSELSQGEKDEYAQRASSEPLSHAERERLWKFNLRRMTRLMEYQKELLPSTEGFFVIAREANAEYLGGTAGGIRYLEQSRTLVEEFSAVPELWAKPSGRVKVKQIRDLFNEKYAAVAGKGKKVPYKKRNFTVSGLPDGFELRRPSRYGTKQLRQIWEARDSISITLDTA